MSMPRKSVIAHRDELIKNPTMRRPHVVILGAGASVAACPDGDTNGRELPTMDTLVEIVDLASVLRECGIDHKGQNFEVVYGSLQSDLSRSEVVREIESRVLRYFSNLELPTHPTVYDHLLLSLPGKDAVFTFDWDPFLFDAWGRNRRFALPEIFFLHGNVRIGYCPDHPHEWGSMGIQCSRCGTAFIPSKLLYQHHQQELRD
jgi:hypothetical protein